jgi:hypothetical protein
VPAAFILTLVATALASIWLDFAGIAFLGIVGTYAAVVIAAALRSARAIGLRTAIVLCGAFPVMHFVYGFGSLRRAVELLVRRGAPQSSPELVPLSR